MANEKVGQHKRMAMGESVPKKYAKGGMVKGLPESPITEAKKANGIPKFKKGGKC